MRLNAAARKRIPKGEFGVPSKAPGSGSYPMPDRAHAGNGKSRAATAEKEGHISKSTEEKIDAKANKILYHGDGAPGSHWSGR